MAQKNQPMLEWFKTTTLLVFWDAYAGRIDEAATDKITAIAHVMPTAVMLLSVMLGRPTFWYGSSIPKSEFMLACCMEKNHRGLLMRGSCSVDACKKIYTTFLSPKKPLPAQTPCHLDDKKGVLRSRYSRSSKAPVCRVPRLAKCIVRTRSIMRP